jgi:D-cysteine desulfhydrase
MYIEPQRTLNKKMTPIQRIADADGRNFLYIKRDDLLTFSFGGNKARKAVLFFEDMKKNNCNCVVTYGSNSSNHCRIIANMAASKNLPCYIISPADASKQTYNSKMIKLLGAKVVQCPASQVDATINATIKELKASGKNPYFIQGGGHGNIGTQAYVDVYTEIVQYEKANSIYFDYIFHASGTGTTQAGLICGMKLQGDIRNIIGISIARKNPRGGQVVMDSVKEYLDSIGSESVATKAINFIDDYVHDGYGSFNDEILKIIREVLLVEGIPLDPTYTGKAFYGMKEYLKQNHITGKNILFIHTGGTPLFFDVMYKLWKRENKHRKDYLGGIV